MSCNIESSYSEYVDANNFYGWTVSQKLPVDGFELIKEDYLLKFNESFIKNYDENSDRGYILKVDSEYSKIFTSYIATFHFYLK